MTAANIDVFIRDTNWRQKYPSFVNNKRSSSRRIDQTPLLGRTQSQQANPLHSENNTMIKSQSFHEELKYKDLDGNLQRMHTSGERLGRQKQRENQLDNSQMSSQVSDMVCEPLKVEITSDSNED